MLLFLCLGILTGFALALRYVGHFKRSLIVGLLFGAVPLALLLGPANASMQGIGSPLRLFILFYGPLMVLVFLVVGLALGVAGASVVLWLRHRHANRAAWITGAAILGATAYLTVFPVVKAELAKGQITADRAKRAEAIIRADFTGTLAGHRVAFPANPRISVTDTCAPGNQGGPFGCVTLLAHPVSILTQPDEVLLNERSDKIVFLSVNFAPPVQTCRPANDFCLTQAKIDHWCHTVRPDQMSRIWCQPPPPLQFAFRARDVPNTAHREEPELAALHADTPVGPADVSCYYSPDPTDTERQGVSCKMSFDLADGVKVWLPVNRDMILSNAPALQDTLAVIPDHWAALTTSP